MSTLIPVKKLDKNGKAVTRHMKPEKAGSSADRLKVLTPKAAPTEREQFIRDCGDFLLDDENEIPLSSLSDAELDNVKALMEKIELDVDFSTMRKLLNPKKHMPYLEAPSLANDLSMLARYNRLDEGVKLHETLTMTRGLESYGMFDESFRDMDEDVKQGLVDTAVTALTLLESIPEGFEYPTEYEDNGEDVPNNLDNYYSFFGGNLEGGGDDALWISNDKFVDLIRQRPEKTGEIIEIMKRRHTLQPSIIEAVLDFDSHSSLKDGAL